MPTDTALSATSPWIRSTPRDSDPTAPSKKECSLTPNMNLPSTRRPSPLILLQSPGGRYLPILYTSLKRKPSGSSSLLFKKPLQVTKLNCSEESCVISRETKQRQGNKASLLQLLSVRPSPCECKLRGSPAWEAAIQTNTVYMHSHTPLPCVTEVIPTITSHFQ